MKKAKSPQLRNANFSPVLTPNERKIQTQHSRNRRFKVENTLMKPPPANKSISSKEMNQDLLIPQFDLTTNNLFSKNLSKVGRTPTEHRLNPNPSQNTSFHFQNLNHPNDDTISSSLTQFNILEAVKVNVQTVPKVQQKRRKSSSDSLPKMPYPRPPMRKPQTASRNRRKHQRIPKSFVVKSTKIQLSKPGTEQKHNL